MIRGRVFSGLLLIGGVAACGGADKAPASPATGGAAAPEPAPEPRTVAEAQEQIEAAAKELAGPDARAKSRSEESKPSSDAPRDEAAKRTSTCATPCRAIRSMRRAVDALCRMTGDADPSCEGAKKTLADNEARVATCGC